ncbi:MAG: porin family protein [Elusimicrobiales bacterium]|nr:porin family protein [Elusimicrobiales bacterium]
MKKVLVAVLLLAGVCSANVAAESGKWEVGGGPGYSMPVGGDWSDAVGGSFNLNAFGAYKIQDPLAVGLELGYDFSHKAKDTAIYDMSDVKTKIFQVTPFVKASKDMTMSGKKVNYYGIFGAGLYSMSTSGSTTPLLAGAQVVDETASAGYFGFNLGGGATMELAPQWSVGLDLRWHHIFSSNAATNNITPTLKVAYMF